MMQKYFTPALIVLFLIFITPGQSFAQVQDSCAPDGSLSVLSPDKVAALRSLQSKVENSCPDILSSYESRLHQSGHTPAANPKCRFFTKKYCEQVNLCAEADVNKKFEGARPAAKSIYEKKLPEIVFTSIFRQRLGVFFEKKAKFCGVNKPLSDCETQFRSAYDIKSDQTAAQYVFERFLKSSSMEATESCQDKLDLNEICQAQKTRLAEIKKCEADPKGTDCLNKEQYGIRLLLGRGNHQNQYPLEVKLALQKEFCAEKRMLRNLEHINERYRKGCEETVLDQVFQAEAEKKVDTVVDSIVQDYEDRYRPDRSSVRKEKYISFEGQNTDFSSPKEETLSAAMGKTNGATDFNLSEDFANSLSENGVTVGGMGKDAALSNANTWSAVSPSNRNNTDLEEQNPAKSNPGQDTSFREKALLEQIESLKNKLSGMDKRVAELNEDPDSKKEGTDEKAELTENQKSIESLKSQLAALQKERKNVADQQAEAQRLSSTNTQPFRAPAAMASSYATAGSNSGGESYDEERDNKTYAPADSGYISSEARGGGAGVGGVATSTSGTSSGGAITLRSTSLASSDASIVYMTDVEIQKYPYRLSGNASEGDIEKMLLGNKGVAVIVGDSEKIVPIIENGAIQYDEKGKIKYKRIKISLVKNEKEKEVNTARTISSIADLKKNDTPKRDVIRYDEMRKNLKLK